MPKQTPYTHNHPDRDLRNKKNGHELENHTSTNERGRNGTNQ